MLKNGIKITKRKEQSSQLFLELRLVEVSAPYESGKVSALSGSLNMFLRQKMELPKNSGKDKKRSGMVTTWDSSDIVIWDKSQVDKGLDESIRKLVEKFCREHVVASSKN